MTRKRSKKRGRDRSREATPSPPPAAVEATIAQDEEAGATAATAAAAPPVEPAAAAGRGVFRAGERPPVGATTEGRLLARSASGQARRRDLARYVGGAVAVC